jgi:hypothetical protein
MSDEVLKAESKFVIDQLSWRDATVEVITATAVAIGLTLLWGLENFRNAFFRLLDRMNLKPRVRRGSAFPPGRPRKLKPLQTERINIA